MERGGSHQLRLYMTQYETMHIAAQYLAMAAKSFLPAQDDDSHTNLGWNSKDKRMESRPLNSEGLILALNYLDYSLDFAHPKSGVGASYPLGGASHLDILNWIGRESKFAGIDAEFKFDLHYELPYEGIFTDEYKYAGKDEDQLNALIQLRWLADKTLSMINTHFHEVSEVRIWPHHFDTGCLGYFDTKKNVSVGLGLAIPDKNVDDWYFYASGYHGEEPIQTEMFEPLKNGEWRSGEWNAGILKASGKSLPVVSSFFNEVIKAF